MTVTEPTQRSVVLDSLRLAAIFTISLLLVVGRGPVWRTVAVLGAAYLFVGVTAKLQYRPVRYSITPTSISREERGVVVEVPIASMTQVKVSSTWRTGDQLTVLGADERLVMDMTKNTEPVAKALGSLLATVGRDRAVIVDGITRAWMGLPEPPMQEPWNGPVRSQTRPSSRRGES